MALISKTYGTGNDSDFLVIDDTDDDIFMDGGAGNDNLSAIHGNGGLTLMGGTGDDTISGRQGDGPLDNAGGSWLEGGIGNDSINAAPLWGGDVQAYGGAGADTIYTNNFYNDVTISGGSGDDTYIIQWENTSSYGIYPVTLVETLDNGTDTIRLLIEHDAYFDMADYVEKLQVTGIWWDNAITDTFDHTNGTYEGAAGSGGGAFISGNFSNNLIDLSDRNDTAYGWTGNDTINGGVGHDEIYGEDGNDILNGGRHNDTITGGAGYDSINGGTENDRLLGDGANDTLVGAAGADTLLGGEGSDKLWGGTEADRLYGENGDDQLRGEAGNDTMSGGAGNDYYFVSDAGDVVVEGQYGGNDLIETALLSISMAAYVENLIVLGGYGPATTRYATGNALGNSFQMKDGVYSLMHDSVSGGAGSDHMILGLGNDTGSGGTENDTMYGDDGNDLLRGDDGSDALYGGNGNDTVEGGLGADNVQGGAGNDQVSGGDANDTVRGGIGNDTVSGGGGADTVYGDDGNDMIYGSDGADRLYGGAGVDWFNYTLASNSTSAARDYIMDFVKGTDKVNLNFMDADATATGNQNFYFSGPGVLSVSPGNVWMKEVLTGTLIEGDVTGDFVADFSILVYGVTGMAQSDVIL